MHHTNFHITIFCVCLEWPNIWIRIYEYIYIYEFTYTFFYKHTSQMLHAICPSTGSQWKAKVVPLLPLLMMIFPTEPGFWATTNKSNLVELTKERGKQLPWNYRLVEKDNMTSPFHGVTSGCGLRCKFRKTWLWRLGYRLSHQKNKKTTPPLGYPNVHHFIRTSCWWP